LEFRPLPVRYGLPLRLARINTRMTMTPNSATSTTPSTTPNSYATTVKTKSV
jgi:hypothetical protein